MGGKYNSILSQIGGTPLVPINRLNSNKDVEILAKLEFFNPAGSIKDRPALYMIEEAQKKGELTKDKIILEATSGNTGIGLSLVAAVKGYSILLVMSESVSEERVKILKAMGAEIKFTPARLGTDGAIEYAYSLVREESEKYWLADQFNNEANWMAHYHGTATEIWEQTNGDLDVIIATIGTSGTVMGISRRFEELKPEVQIVGVEPYLGHKIQGLKNMKESYRPGIFQKKRLDRIINSVLDVMDLKPTKVDQDVVALIHKREQARRNKEWDTADRLRQELTARGIEVIDTKDGPAWHKAKVVD